jgi:stage II sporulation protein P
MKNTSTYIPIVITNILVILSTIIILLCTIKQIGEVNQRDNLFFIQILNNTIPVAKTVSFDSENMAESQLTIKNTILKFVGININNPCEILDKEICYMNIFGSQFNKNKDQSVDNIIKVNPFNLNAEGAITKNAPVKTNTSINSKVYDPSLKKTLNKDKPEILIYHTHTTEAYSPGPNDNDDESQSVCGVGTTLADILQNDYGISVVHDKTVHTRPNYTTAYTRSRETLTKDLNQYKDYKLVIDLHRDSGPERPSVTTTVNNENLLKMMFVMAKKNPHYDKNLAVVNKLLNITNKLYPTFCRGIFDYDYGTKFFNQDLSNNAILVEFGAEVNTVDEAQTSAKYLARIIAEYINGKN